MVDADNNQDECVFKVPRALEAQYARDVSASNSQGKITVVGPAPDSLVQDAFLHDAEVVSVTALGDGHFDVVRRPRTAQIRHTTSLFRYESHMENSVNSNGSPECYKG